MKFDITKDEKETVRKCFTKVFSTPSDIYDGVFLPK